MRVTLFGSVCRTQNNPNRFSSVYKFPKRAHMFTVFRDKTEGSYGLTLYYTVDGVEKKVSTKINEETVEGFRQVLRDEEMKRLGTAMRRPSRILKYI